MQLVLTDNTGKTYERVALDLPSDATGPSQNSHAAPILIFDEVAVFVVPRANSEFLRLEIQTKNWGGTRPFRFTIPKTMIGANPLKGSRPRWAVVIGI